MAQALFYKSNNEKFPTPTHPQQLIRNRRELARRKIKPQAYQELPRVHTLTDQEQMPFERESRADYIMRINEAWNERLESIRNAESGSTATAATNTTCDLHQLAPEAEPRFLSMQGTLPGHDQSGASTANAAPAKATTPGTTASSVSVVKGSTSTGFSSIVTTSSITAMTKAAPLHLSASATPFKPMQMHPNRWSCSACTFANVMRCIVCEMCATPRHPQRLPDPSAPNLVPSSTASTASAATTALNATASVPAHLQRDAFTNHASPDVTRLVVASEIRPLSSDFPPLPQNAVTHAAPIPKHMATTAPPAIATTVATNSHLTDPFDGRVVLAQQVQPFEKTNREATIKATCALEIADAAPHAQSQAKELAHMMLEQTEADASKRRKEEEQRLSRLVSRERDHLAQTEFVAEQDHTAEVDRQRTAQEKLAEDTLQLPLRQAEAQRHQHERHAAREKAAAIKAECKRVADERHAVQQAERARRAADKKQQELLAREAIAAAKADRRRLELQHQEAAKAARIEKDRLAASREQEDLRVVEAHAAAEKAERHRLVWASLEAPVPA